MCGIAGILNFNGAPVSPAILRRMTDAIAHRGPDAEGEFVEGAVGLGHRRLAIIDLTPAANQPMQTPDGRFTISYNGEVYNFRELRIELTAAGVRFRSQSDTEVVLALLAREGAAGLARLNGMFALALWDREREELLLARDRYGIKPLYTAQRGNVFLFGSEVKAMLAHPELAAEMDREALFEYFTFQNYFSDRTLFRNVRLLAPGCWMRLSLRLDVTETVRYWDYDFREPEGTHDSRDYAHELDRLFRQAVSRQLVSDVEVGAYLSGGIDSGSITATAARQLPYMKTFTCGFDLHSASGIEIGFDEREKAEHMSYRFRTEHYEMVLKAGDMERAMPRLTSHLEEPRVGQSYPNFYAAQLAGKFVKVVLSGAGGDELFGGYPWRYYRAVVNDDFDHYAAKYYEFWQRLVDADAMAQLFAPIWHDVRGVSTETIFRDVFKHHARELQRPEDYVNHSLYFEAKTFLHGLLVMEDKLSMAHGLETRLPFLDNDLVDFAMRVPVGLKLGNLAEVVRLNENEPGPKTQRYFERTRDGKLLLRQAVERYVPGEITNGIKQGFSAPDAAWFKGDSIDYLRHRLLDGDARIYAYLDRATVRQLIEDHLESRRNRRLLIWSLLSVESFCERFLG